MNNQNPHEICSNCEKEFREHFLDNRCHDSYSGNPGIFSPSNRITFDLQKALAGWPVLTRDGQQVPDLVQEIPRLYSSKLNRYWVTNGTWTYKGQTHPLDLFLVADWKPEEVVVSKEDADKLARCAERVAAPFCNDLSTFTPKPRTREEGADVQPEGGGTDSEVPIQRSRLFDLVRYMRSELLKAELITFDEYTWLLTAADEGQIGKGSISRKRLDEYDALRATLAATQRERDEARMFPDKLATDNATLQSQLAAANAKLEEAEKCCEDLKNGSAGWFIERILSIINPHTP